jgi:myxalamid-type polyketide synthase MxaE and MxaD
VNDFIKRIADFSPKRLLLLAAELEERVRALEHDLTDVSHGPIAIVGMGCRFPGGVRGAQSFWQLLEEGRDAITEVPRSRWDIATLYDPDPHAEGKVATKWGGFLDAPDLFDAAFFGIAPVEANSMDPQQRLLLEVSWEALEDAGIAPTSLNGTRTGVFAGICNSDYAQLAMARAAKDIDTYAAQGASHAVAAGRVSYFLGLRGPSLAIDTACSSSLVAIHEACQSLRQRETDLALAGGVNLLFAPEVTMALSRAQMMAADGRCKAFSAAANGFVRSEGCGVLVLKRLADALRDGDRVQAVIRGTALNQDGRSSGLTAPNGPSQVEVIRAALADAGVSADAISYVEAHGTGTSLGDTIEMQALGEALGRVRSDDNRLPVGSVKSNFGHAESAAGVAGLIKLVLALNKRVLPASLHCVEPNPKIDWEASRTRVPVANEPWEPAPGHTTRMGAVSSFGFSGTNAHIVVSEWPSEEASSRAEESDTNVIALSAQSEPALRTMAARLADCLREQPELRLADVAYTLAVGRSVFAERAAIQTGSKQHLIEELSELARSSGQDTEDVAAVGFTRGRAGNRAPRIAFLFAGQGGERTGMGLSLLQHSPVFRIAVEEVDAALKDVLTTKIEAMFRNENDELSHSSMVQPALFAFQYGMARVWQSWGIEPSIVAGHSMGEIVAATIAGVMSVPDAARLIAARGRLTEELGEPGGMVAINAPEQQVHEGLQAHRSDVSIAAVNGPSSVVISGRSAAVEQATQSFERAGIRVKRLNITYGSHSPAMHRVLPAFRVEADRFKHDAPRIPIVADLTGARVEDASVFDAQYWTDHLSRPVQFARCLDRLAEEKCGLCIEMGPRAVLTAFGRERGESDTHWIASANGRDEDYYALQSALAEAFAAGALVNWKGVFAGKEYRKVALPTYPFERERYWIQDAEEVQSELRTMAVERNAETGAGKGLGVRLDVSVPIFEMDLTAPLPWHLDQHRVHGRAMMPASGYLALAWNAAADASARDGADVLYPFAMRDLRMTRPLQLDGAASTLQTVLSSEHEGEEEPSLFRVSSRVDAGAWMLHATGSVGVGTAEQDVTMPEFSFDLSGATRLGGREFYQKLMESGIALGGAFRGVEELWFEGGSAHGRVVIQEEVNGAGPTLKGPEPAALDACFQVLGGAAIAHNNADDGVRLRLMTGIRSMVIYGPLLGELTVDARIEEGQRGALEGSLTVRDRNGKLLAAAGGIELREVSTQELRQSVTSEWVYEPTWEVCPAGLSQRNTKLSWKVVGGEQGIARSVVRRLIELGERVELVTDLNELSARSLEGSSEEWVDLRAVEGMSVGAHDSRGSENEVPLEERVKCLGEAAIVNTYASSQIWAQAVRNKASLWVFTCGAQQVTCTPAGAVQKPLWGLARCATLEQPQALRRIVDIDPMMSTEQRIESIVSELLATDGEEQVAYREAVRSAFRIRRAKRQAGPSLKIEKEGAYLLTGGVGGLGIRVAAWLAGQGARRLVLTTRSQESIAARTAELDAIRGSGVGVDIECVDVAEVGAMERLIASFGHGERPALRGVIHMAAAVNSAPVEEVTDEGIRQAFRAKVDGTWVLHALTRDTPLDFFIAFSSTAAQFGAGRLGQYAAANIFLDAVASIRAGEGLPFQSISWGTWQTMRLASEQAQQQILSGGLLPMDDEQALSLLSALGGLPMDGGSLRTPIVADVDWSMLAPLYESKRERKWLTYVREKTSAVTKSHTAGSILDVDALMATPDRTSALEQLVQKEAARVLGLRRGDLPDRHARLADLGLDSLMAVTLRNRLQTVVGQRLLPTFAFEYPTPAEMAVALDLLLWSSSEAETLETNLERDEISI